MPQVLIEDFREFAARQGGNQIRIGGSLYFPSGATCNAETGDFRMEPPADVLLCLKHRRKYHTERLTRMETDFHELKNVMLAGEGRVNLRIRYEGVTGDGLTDLEVIRTHVLKERAALLVIEDALAQTPEGKQKARAARVDAEQEQRARSEAARIAGKAAAINI